MYNTNVSILEKKINKLDCEIKGLTRDVRNIESTLQYAKDGDRVLNELKLRNKRLDDLKRERSVLKSKCERLKQSTKDRKEVESND